MVSNQKAIWSGDSSGGWLCAGASNSKRPFFSGVLLSALVASAAVEANTYHHTVELTHSYESIEISSSVAWQFAEEVVHTGRVFVFSCDFELPRDSSKMYSEQIVGLRFPDVAVPWFANVQSAVLQFSAKQPGAGPVVLEVLAERTGSAEHFLPDVYSGISSRNWTTASVLWSPGTWYARGDVSTAQSIDIAPLLQEVVSLDGWTSSSALVLSIRRHSSDNSTYYRVAETGRVPTTIAPTLTLTYDHTPAPSITKRLGYVGAVGAAAAAVFMFSRRLRTQDTLRKRRMHTMAEWQARSESIHDRSVDAPASRRSEHFIRSGSVSSGYVAEMTSTYTPRDLSSTGQDEDPNLQRSRVIDSYAYQDSEQWREDLDSPRSPAVDPSHTRQTRSRVGMGRPAAFFHATAHAAPIRKLRKCELI